jgi:type II secretory pathway pseudopilin PulG
MRLLGKRQAGFISYSLPELAVVLVVLGLLVITATTMIRVSQKATNSAQAKSLFQAIDHALIGFVYANGRLPCPAAASDVTGMEDCSIKTGGVLPYQTLGMAAQVLNHAGLAFRYAEFSNPTINVQLNLRVDLIKPYYASGTPPVALSQTLGKSSDMDLCRALSSGSDAKWNAATDVSQANIKSIANIINGTSHQFVAYVIADPGVIDADNNLSLVSVFDGKNSAGVTFELPSRGISSSYDDRVHAVYFDEVWEGLGCSGIVSTVSHAHPNVKSTTAILKNSLIDYKKQLELAVDYANASQLTAAAQLSQAGAGFADAVSLVPAAIAESLLTVPVGPYVLGPGAVGLAVAAVVVNTAATVVATLDLSYLTENLIPLTEKEVTLINKVIDDTMIPLDNSVDANMKAADQAAIYER